VARSTHPEPAVAELSWPQVHAFRLSRHHLAHRAAPKDLARVVGDIGGAQAQVMSAAELQVGVRVDCSVRDVRSALWERKTLVKTWLMRGTLHLIPAADLPLYTAVLNNHWVRIRPSWLKYVGLSETELFELVDAIGDALDGRALTREEIVEVVGKHRSEHVREVLRSGWGGILKPAARSGRLCFGPSRGQNVTFVRPSDWLGSWHEVKPAVALAEVARRYLRAFGPSVKNDFAFWWGHWAGVAGAAWTALEGELATVSIEGQRAQMLATDLVALGSAPQAPCVTMLPNFDPYLMGHASRNHLFDETHRWKVSRTAGWISSVVLVRGRVEATWSQRVGGQTLHVTVAPFQPLPPKVLREVRRCAESIAATLGLARAEVTLS
jgi:hypothetical protein